MMIFNATLLMLAGFGAHRLLRREQAALRHLVWVLTFAAMLLLPLTAPLVPKIYVPFPTPSLASREPRNASVEAGSPPLSTATANRDVNGFYPTGAKTETPTTDWLLLSLVAIWATGFFWVVGRAAWGLLAVHSMRRFGSRDIPPAALALDPQHLASRIGLHRSVDLIEATAGQPATALTWGVWRPVVLLPLTAQAWTPERLEAVLLHEFAHVRRLDFLSQLMAEAACAVYWFNPLVWLGARAMREDAESAADDVVLGTGMRPSLYAEELLRIAAEIGKRRTLTLHPGIPTMNPTKIETRLQSVLAPTARRRGLTHVQVVATLSIATIALPALASLQGTQAAQSPSDIRTEALNRVKQLATASHIYAADYDDLFPYVQQTASAKGVLSPYVRNSDIFESPTKGARFLFNLNLAGVELIAVESPAETPMWMEEVPKGVDYFAVAYADGHARSLPISAKASVVAVSTKRFARRPDSRPLPKYWMVKK